MTQTTAPETAQAETLSKPPRLIPAEMTKGQAMQMAGNLAAEFGTEFTLANKAFALAVYDEAYALGSPAPSAPAAVPEDVRKLSDDLMALDKAATPGEWLQLDLPTDYGPGPNFMSYGIEANGKTLADTLNSGTAMLEEEHDGEGGVYTWDAQGKADTAFIVALVSAYRGGRLTHASWAEHYMRLATEKGAALRALATPTGAGTETREAEGLSALANARVLDISEWDDRTSPEDWPEALLITPDELHREFLAFAAEAAALAPATPAPAVDGAEALRALSEAASPGVWHSIVGSDGRGNDRPEDRWLLASSLNIGELDDVDFIMSAKDADFAAAAVNFARKALATRTPAGAAGDPAETDALVDRFATALKAKLRASEVKYGWQNGWLKAGWEAECQRGLAHHITKGDPLDVAAYTAFCWHHGWPTWAPRNHSDETTGAVVPSPEGEAAYQARFPGAPLSDCPDWAIDAWNRVALAAISAGDAGEAAASDQTSAIALEAWRQLKPCPSDESDALCSFPSCNCAVQRLAYSSPRSTAVPADGGTSGLVTHAMIQAGRYAANLSDGTLAGIYQAMHSASCPTAPVVSDGKTAEARDDVLFAFNRYVNNPTPFEVTWWTRHFPQFAKDIRENAVEVIDMNHRVEALGPNDLPTASSANLRNSIIDIIRFTNRVGNAGVEIYGVDEAAAKIMAAIGEGR